MADVTESIPRSVWYGWGDPGQGEPLSEYAVATLAAELGMHSIAPVHQPVALEDVVVGPSAITGAQRSGLEAIVGAGNVLTGRTERILHAGGKSTTDLLRRRSGDATAAPDAVVCPTSTGQVREVLDYCVAQRIALVPFGGGTSVVGGVEPDRGGFDTLITLDVRQLDRLTKLDPLSRIATFEAGIRGPALEAALAERGFTLGHFPQSHQEATLGGYAATRSAGQSSTGYGRSNDLISALRLETPTGTLRLGGHAPADAAGPRLLDLVLGSEGILGVITEVSILISPVPQTKSYGAWSFPTFQAGTDALRALVQDAARSDVPDVCRLSDPDETSATFQLAGGTAVDTLRRYLAARGQQHPALAVFVWEGKRSSTAARRRRCARILRSHGGVWVSGSPARSWDAGRFSAPYRRDELLSRGVFVETLETAALWSNLLATHERVRTAIVEALSESGAHCQVHTHLSHLYRNGASLYYTFLAPLEGDGLEQFRRTKAAASEAIVTAGATITHHHGVGQEHAGYLAAEIGDLGERMLAAVKKEVDPTGILNPGKLLQERRS